MTVLQPLDLNIIRATKTSYRNRIFINIVPILKKQTDVKEVIDRIPSLLHDYSVRQTTLLLVTSLPVDFRRRLG